MSDTEPTTHVGGVGPEFGDGSPTRAQVDVLKRGDTIELMLDVMLNDEESLADGTTLAVALAELSPSAARGLAAMLTRAAGADGYVDPGYGDPMRAEMADEHRAEMAAMLAEPVEP